MPVTRRLIAQALRVVGVEPDTVSDVEIALSEACANVLRHAQIGDSYEVRAGFDQERAFLEIIDQGAGFADTSRAAGRRRRRERARGRAHAGADGQGAFRIPQRRRRIRRPGEAAAPAAGLAAARDAHRPGASDRAPARPPIAPPSFPSRRLSRRRNRRGRRRPQSSRRSTTVDQRGPPVHAIGVVTFPGSLDDRDALRAVTLAGARAGAALARRFRAARRRCGRAARRLLLRRLPARRSHRPFLPGGRGGRRSGPQRAAGARHLQRFPGAVRSRPAAGRAHAQCRAALRLPRSAADGGEHRHLLDRRYEPGATIVIPVKHGDGRFVAEPVDHHRARSAGSGRLPLRRRQSERLDRRHRRRLLRPTAASSG